MAKYIMARIPPTGTCENAFVQLTLFTSLVAFPLSTIFPHYKIHEQYSLQPFLYPYSSSGSTTSNTTGSRDSQMLPPLSTSPVSKADHASHSQNQRHHLQQHTSIILIPMLILQSIKIRALIISLTTSLNSMALLPWLTASIPSNVSHVPPGNYSWPPVSLTSPKGPMIKTQRKWANAAELNVLNAVYAQIAFPSTEERAAVEKMLRSSLVRHFPYCLFYIWIADKRWVDRFQNQWLSMRENNRESTSAVSGSYCGHCDIDQGEGDPLLHPLSDYNISYEPCTDAIYMSGGHPCDFDRYVLHCHCHCNDFYYHHPSSLQRLPPRRFQRLSQAAGYKSRLSPHFLTSVPRWRFHFLH